MRPTVLVRRSLVYYWRTHLPVVLGVALAVAVLTGALVIGDSVRSSLREIFLGRLGNASHVLLAGRFFRTELATELQAHPSFQNCCQEASPMIVMEGLVVHQESRRRAGAVQVYGIDERFWKFHGLAPPPGGMPPRAIWTSPALELELKAQAGETLLLRLEKPSSIPAESLHGNKEDRGQTLRCTHQGVLPGLGEFSFRARQSEVRAVFLPLSRLQRELAQQDKVNSLLISSREGAPHPAGTADRMLAEALRSAFRLADIGLRLRQARTAETGIVEHESMILSPGMASAIQKAAERTGLTARPVLTYLVNSLRIRDKEIPYSLVSALDLQTPPSTVATASGQLDSSALPPLFLNSWAARELGARPGERITLEYYLWLEAGRLTTSTSDFRVQGFWSLEDGKLGPDLAPEYPGITDTLNIREWDPPFPMDLSRIRDVDEAYWKQYRTTPKAVIAPSTGRALWGSRQGEWTSFRLSSPAGGAWTDWAPRFEALLREELDPLQSGFLILPVREEGLAAAAGSTDFSEYFLYFSFFLLVSALLLIGLFFKLSIDQRGREIGLLKALGYPRMQIARLLIAESGGLAFLGALLGLLGAAGYGSLVLYGLKTWWIGAVGTPHLKLEMGAPSLLLGGTGGLLAALLCMAWTLRGLLSLAPRPLLSGSVAGDSPGSGVGHPSFAPAVRWAGGLLGVLLLCLAWGEWIPATGAFFGAGIVFLTAFLADQTLRLRRASARPLRYRGWTGLAGFGFRNAAIRPGRSVLCMTLIACATFLIGSVGAFRREGSDAAVDKRSGGGGYALVGESVLPLLFDPQSPEGRQALNLTTAVSGKSSARWSRFRLRSGDDASCLNLYQPKNPRLLAPSADFLREARFEFGETLAETREEKENPWLLLEKALPDGAVPAIADATSLAYVLHLKVGQEWVTGAVSGRPIRFRLVAALSHSLFQSELLISESHFKRLFPELEGWRFFLIETDKESAGVVARQLEESLSDYGLDLVAAADRLEAYHRVENTYLSTFQGLGLLGLLLGTFGLAAVLLRNALERRREMALQRAVGFGPGHLAWTILAENGRLLLGGVFAGTVCALLAVLPALLARGGSFPLRTMLVTLIAVIGTGFLSSLIAAGIAVRASLLEGLRSE